MRRPSGSSSRHARATAVLVVSVVGASLLGATVLAAERFPALFTVTDPAITESSGLVDRGDTVLTVNDSGDTGVVYVLDPRTGGTIGRTTYVEDPVDVEALARGRRGEIWVGDIGDNAAAREVVSIYRLPAVVPGDRSVAPTRFDLAYPGGARDAEALLVDPRDGRLLVVSKGLFGGAIYQAPATLSPDRVNRLRRIAAAPGLVTDGEFFADGRHVVLRTYSQALVYDTATWRALGSVPLPDQPQGEGVSVRRSGTALLVSTEGVGEPVRVARIPQRLLAAMAAPSTQPSTQPAEPTTGPATEDGQDPATPGDPADADTLSGTDVTTVFALAAAALAAALGVRAVVRTVRVRGARRRTRRTP